MSQSENQYRIEPVGGETHEGRQWGFHVMDGDTVLAHCTTGGTGECWNIGLLDEDDHFGPLGGTDDGSDIHICDLDVFIAVLTALRDSTAHAEHVARWRR